MTPQVVPPPAAALSASLPLCEECNIPIEPEVLAASSLAAASVEAETLEAEPLARLCLECLSPDDRRELEDDLEKAALVQRGLLPPRRLARDGWEMAWLWEPKNTVSGDHVDLLAPDQPGEPMHLLLGDVVGKGVAASLLQTHLHALLRASALPELCLADILARVNGMFSAVTGAASYATLVGASVYPNGRLELANAGHPRPLLADRRGVRPVEGAGLPLGLFGDTQYSSHTLRLQPGDTLLFYSDGWTEAEALGGDPSEEYGEEYGIGRAAAALRRSADRPLAELLAACRADMERFLDGTPRSDDLTFLALRRTV